METRRKERNIMSETRNLRGRLVKVALFGALALTLGGCDAVDRLLEVKNPEELRDQDLANQKLIKVLTSSAQGDFQAAYDDPFIWIGEMLTDEEITGVNYEDYKRTNNRQVIYSEGPARNMFAELQGARYTAKLSYEKLQAIEEVAPGTVTGDQFAKVLGYQGYSYILLADAMCESTIDEGGEIYTPQQLYGTAIDLLKEGLAQATTVDVRNWLNVGVARASLDRLEYAQAAQYAAAVTDPNFVKWVEYVDDTRADDELYGWNSGSNFTIGINPRWMNGGTTYWLKAVPDSIQTDPRIQHWATSKVGHDASTPLYKIYQPWSYSGYTGNTIATGAVRDSDTGVQQFQRNSSIKLATYLEAQHILYEAGLWSNSVSAAEVLTFVNARRAYGNQPAVDYTGEALKNELREQRGKDLFFGGFRLGDLRRYAAQGNPPAQHAFPTGQHPVVERGIYFDGTCFPIPLTEYQGNGKIKDPHTGG